MFDYEFLPEPYAEYRPVLVHGLIRFLGHVPASPAALVAALRQSPVLHKLGQVVARDHRLAPELRSRLQELESLPATPITPAMRAGLPAGLELAPVALAEGSVAVVVEFQSARHEGVLKILKPGIEEQLERDLGKLGELGAHLDEDCRRYHLPPIDYRDSFETIRQLLRQEVRLDREQTHLAEAAEVYREETRVVIPGLLPFCSPRITAMTRIEGRKLADGEGLRPGLARTVADALVARPILSGRAAALFHGDPHAGNLFVTPTGQLAILDWSLAGHLRARERRELSDVVWGACVWSVTRMHDAVARLATHRFDSVAAREILRASLGQMPGVGWLTRLLDALATNARVRFRPELLLFRKALLTLEGVLSGTERMEEAVLAAWLRGGAHP